MRTLSARIFFIKQKKKRKLGTIVSDEQIQQLMIDYTINVLGTCIQHPTKPGYNRHDIIEKMEQLKQQSC